VGARPRRYQLEALERALAGNTLVFLETGAGKTLIAVLLLRRFAHRIRSAPPPSFAVFLVPTVVLVNQQAGVIEAHTDLRVAQFYGEKGVDFWDADTWREKIDGAEVLVMTPQILLDNLRHSKFRLRDIPLLIFDECHHATGNSPYACIFKVTRKLEPRLAIFVHNRPCCMLACTFIDLVSKSQFSYKL